MLDGPPSPEFSCIDGSNVYGICPVGLHAALHHLFHDLR